jgi:DNA-nicking Smr family endonuclease
MPPEPPAAEPLPTLRPLRTSAAPAPAAPAAARAVQPHPAAGPERIEPARKRRIAREREPLGGRLDLHGLDQERARATLHGFIARAHEDGARAVLIITGKGVQGDGVLRRRVPDWLAEAPSRARVAGYAMAERHHGGEGALYVALKRKGR